MKPNKFYYIKSKIEEYNGITYYTNIGNKESFIFLRDGKSTIVPKLLLEEKDPLYEIYGISLTVNKRLR